MDQINTKQEENIFQWVFQRVFFYVSTGRLPEWPFRYMWAKRPLFVFMDTFPEDPIRITALFIKLIFRQMGIDQFVLLARAPGMLKDAVNACRSAGLKPFLLFGTLRGFILKNDFLPRTCDLDFGLLEKDYDKRGLLIKCMLDKGYRIGINAEYELLFHSNESHLLMIDFFNVYEKNDETVISTGFAENKKLVSNHFPAGLFEHFRMVGFYRVKVLVPVLSKEFIKLHYGPWSRDFINKRHHIEGRTNVRLEDKFYKPMGLSGALINFSSA